MGVAPKRQADDALDVAPKRPADDALGVAPKRPADGLDLPSGAPRAPAPATDTVVSLVADAMARRDAGNPRGVRVKGRASRLDQARGRRDAKTSEVRQTQRREPDLAQPKVIVDIGQFSDAVAAPTPEREEALAPDAGLAEAAFAPLNTPAPMPGALDGPGLRATVAPPEAFPPDDPADVRPIRPPAMGWLALLALVALLAAAFAYVWWRNDWAPVWENPTLALDVAVGRTNRPALPQAPPTVVQAAGVEGTLEIGKVRFDAVPLGKKEVAGLISGEIKNNTNRVQRGVTLEAILADAPQGMPLRTRVAACCDVYDVGQAADVARHPDLPHFTDVERAAQVRLMPGETRPFSVILLDVDPELLRRPIHPSARVRFAEAERAAP